MTIAKVQKEIMAEISNIQDLEILETVNYYLKKQNYSLQFN